MESLLEIINKYQRKREGRDFTKSVPLEECGIIIAGYKLSKLISDVDFRLNIIHEFRGNTIRESEYLKANLGRLVFDGITIENVIFSEKSFRLIEFRNCTFVGCRFISCNMQNIVFNSCIMYSCYFDWCLIDRSTMFSCYISDSYFNRTDFCSTVLNNTMCLYNTFAKCLFISATIKRKNLLFGYIYIDEESIEHSITMDEIGKSKLLLCDNDFQLCNFSNAKIDIDIFAQADPEVAPSFRKLVSDKNNVFDGATINNDIAKSVYIPLACPSEGSFIGWKKVKVTSEMMRNKFSHDFISDGKVHFREELKDIEDNTPLFFLIKLLIPEDAKRSSATTGKCRCDKAKVLGIYYLDGTEVTAIDTVFTAVNMIDTAYRVGEMVYPDSFDDDRWNECSHGIHFFVDKEAAIAYKIW